ncbi:MAG: hypothetical protein OEQ14_17985, partial [Gammaproteobacteria bacterium]|nr:hypothetical protein [Gammaproteobacteria bacterium]
LSGNVALLDAKMRDTLDPSGGGFDISGQRPAGAPEWTFNLIGEYTMDLGSNGTLQLRADYRGRSDVFNQTSSRNVSPAPRLRPQINDWGARISWENADQDMRFSLWGKNLREDFDISNFGPPSPCCQSFAAGFRGKTSYGLTASFDF